jgi:hypothetical protein
VPKSKKTNKSVEENRTAWRTPVKLPASAATAPMKSLYAQDKSFAANDWQTSPAADVAPLSSVRADDEFSRTEPQKTSELPPANRSDETEKPTSADVSRPNADASSTLETNAPEAENTATRMSAAEFLKLLRTDKMDFYSLAEILRGSSMALYCVLYAESLAKGENRCQIRQSELMMRAGINNPATLYKQERWLTVLGLISKTVRLGNHNGASYEVRPLQILPAPDFILEQFDGYLSELVK